MLLSVSIAFFRLVNRVGLLPVSLPDATTDTVRLRLSSYCNKVGWLADSGVKAVSPSLSLNESLVVKRTVLSLLLITMGSTDVASETVMFSLAKEVCEAVDDWLGSTPQAARLNMAHKMSEWW